MALWPQPRLYEAGSSTLWLSPHVKYAFETISTPKDVFDEIWSEQQVLGRNFNSDLVDETPKVHTASSKEILQAAVNRTKLALFSDRFVPYKFHPRNTGFEPSATSERKYIHQINIEEHQLDGSHDARKYISRDAYSMHIANEGVTTIKIVSFEGGLYALSTFSQLFYAHSGSEPDLYITCVPLTIEDSPVFKHRGLNLDIARNRIAPKDVRRTLDAMSFNKLNRLHLHATDSQSWPLEIPELPELALKGAYHKSEVWTVDDLKDVQEYGSYRGVEVYVELDMPGHTASIHHAYPNLITAFNQQAWEIYALEPPSGQLKLKSPEVPPFLTTLFNDLLPRISPYSSHFHVGGDELNTEAYTLEPAVNSSSKDVLRPLLQSFYDHVFSHITAHSLTPVVWEEILLDWDIDLPPSTIIQTWRKPASLASVVARGHKAIFGNASHWYLDCGLGTWLDPNLSNPDTSVKPPYHDWNPPYKNWRQVLSYNPLEGIPDDDAHLVLGGEVHLWGEMTDSVNLDGMLWPRVAAAAEVLWKGKSEVNEDATRRLAEMRERLVGRGIAAGMVQMEWCLENAGGCLY
ncbi:N-acetyl-glucosamine-6-phosphate deacetylase [Lambiella insularis]|nr:N-acetyl-glucosamine-6-phosphate deacetylase [Lambiella insularis]